MSTKGSSHPDYELADEVIASSPDQIRALGHPLRMRLLGLVGERAGTITEMATTVERPKSTVANHVNVLVDAGLMKIVRTRKVRAIEERFYGRVARSITVAPIADPDDAATADARDSSKIRDFTRATTEAIQDPDMHCLISTFRVPAAEAEAFRHTVSELARELLDQPQDSDTLYGFVAGFYTSSEPGLPSPTPQPDWQSPESRET